MHCITLFRTPKKPARPTLADMASIGDPQLQRLALVELNRLLDAELADVYHPIGAPFWNVWLSHRLVPGGERVRLEDWCERFVAQHADGSRPGGGAA
jgi:hypothetical protein